MTRALFVSAHLDDAVLSCGGTIATVPSMVVTVFGGAGSQPTLSPFASRYHLTSGLVPDAAQVMGLRRREDAAACRRLGAAYLHLDLPEALYRRSRAAEPRCTTGGDLFSAFNEDDLTTLAEARALLTEILRTYRPGLVYIPAAIGGHLDHRIARRAALAAVRAAGPDRSVEVLLYEDLPYAVDPEEVAVAAHLSAITEVVVCRVDQSTMDRKRAAAQEYESQRRLLCADDVVLEDVLAEHARRVGDGDPLRPYGERAWRWPRRIA